MKRTERFRILLFGGNQLACKCLTELMNWKQVEITAVVARYNDYGSVVDPNAWNASLVRVAAQEGLSFLQPKYLEDSEFIKELNLLSRPDFILCVQYDKNIDAGLLQYAKIGAINFHFAILPHNRGYFPISWSLIDKKPVGVTMHWMGEALGSGDIISSQMVDAKPYDTAQSLYFKITEEAFRVFKQFFPLVLEGRAPRIPQPMNGNSYHPQEYPFDRTINWRWNAENIDRMVRALTFPPYPAARTYMGDLEIEFLNPVQIIRMNNHEYSPGQVIDIQPGGIVVQTQQDCLLVSKIRINESLIMNSIKFSQQYNIHIGDRFHSAKVVNGKMNSYANRTR